MLIGRGGRGLIAGRWRGGSKTGTGGFTPAPWQLAVLASGLSATGSRRRFERAHFSSLIAGRGPHGPPSSPGRRLAVTARMDEMGQHRGRCVLVGGDERPR